VAPWELSVCLLVTSRQSKVVCCCHGNSTTWDVVWCNTLDGDWCRELLEWCTLDVCSL